MKRLILGLLALLLLATAVSLVFPNAREELHWRWASYQSQPRDFAGYLALWPSGRHISEAKRLYDERSWADATASATVQAFDAYLSLHPQGKYSPQAKDNIENLRWEEAKKDNTVTSYQRYLAHHLQGKYVAEAQKNMEHVGWEKAKRDNTVVSYQRYIETYPAGRLVVEAKANRASLLKDDAPYLAAKERASRQAYEAFLSQFPGHRRETDARAALKDMEGRDIVDLLAQKKIEVRTRGSGIESVGLEVRRLVNHEINVLIPVGTFFASRRASAQNMVTTKEERVSLRKSEWVSLSISAACANRPRDIPGSEDTFSVERSPGQKELQKLMPILRKSSAGSAVQQAAVWIVTDNADYDDLGVLVQSVGPIAFGGSRVINEYEAALAMKICEEAGIAITRKAIWRDRNQIIRGLKDENLKKWIQDRAKG